MVKGQTESGNVFFGITQENIRRLRAGDDLGVDCSVIGVNCWVRITVLQAGSSAGLLYTDTKGGKQPRLYIALPDDHLQHLIGAGLATLHTKRVGAPFDLMVHIGENEQSIIESLNYTGRVIDETKPAAGVH